MFVLTNLGLNEVDELILDFETVKYALTHVHIFGFMLRETAYLYFWLLYRHQLYNFLGIILRATDLFEGIRMSKCIQ